MTLDGWMTIKIAYLATIAALIGFAFWTGRTEAIGGLIALIIGGAVGVLMAHSICASGE